MANIALKNLSSYLNKMTIAKSKEATENAIKKWRTVAANATKDKMLNMIANGQSPVKNGGGQTGGGVRFKDYSDSYKKQIKDKKYTKYGKKLRPVNLNLSGKMLRTIKSRETKDGFSIWFTSPIAKYHNVEGAGKSKVKRKMLPVDKGDEFSKVIERELVDSFQSILNQELKRN